LLLLLHIGHRGLQPSEFLRERLGFLIQPPLLARDLVVDVLDPLMEAVLADREQAADLVVLPDDLVKLAREPELSRKTLGDPVEVGLERLGELVFLELEVSVAVERDADLVEENEMEVVRARLADWKPSCMRLRRRNSIP
jgi:hypothetical protein